MVLQKTVDKQGTPNHSNLARVFVALREAHQLTKKRLCFQLGLSRPTIDKAIEKLLSCGLAKRNGCSPSAGGRRAVFYTLNMQAGSIIGCDLELPELNLVITGLDGIPITARNITLSDDCIANPRRTFGLMNVNALEMLEELESGADKLIGLGLGVPAFLGENTISISGQSLPQWARVPAQSILEQLFNIPVSVENDVNCMAMTEHYEANHGDKVMGYIALRKGLKGSIRMGASILLGGKVFHGGNGNAALLQSAYVDTSELDRIRQNDPCATLGSRQVVAMLVDQLVTPLIHMVRLLDPNRLVIDASILEQGEKFFIDEIRERLNTESGSGFSCRIEMSNVEDRSLNCAKGAALHALHQLFNQPVELIERLTGSVS